MPTLHIRNGREGLAVSFRYQASPTPSITWRGTYPLTLRQDMVQPWKDVAYGRGPDAHLAVYHEAPDKRFVIKSHADAIHYLGLPASVVRAVSLQQMRLEDRVRADRKKSRQQAALLLIACGKQVEFGEALPMV